MIQLYLEHTRSENLEGNEEWAQKNTFFPKYKRKDLKTKNTWVDTVITIARTDVNQTAIL